MLYYDRVSKAFMGILQVDCLPQVDHTDVNCDMHEVTLKPWISLQPTAHITDLRIYPAVKNSLFFRQARFVITQSEKIVFEMIYSALNKE